MPAPGPIVRYAKYGALAFEFSGTIAASAALGWLIDDWLGTAPWGIVGATLLGVIGGFVRLVELARRFERRDREA